MAQIISRDGKMGLVSGLSWGALTSDNREAAVRERARELEAKKAIVLSQGNRYSVGLGFVDDDDGKPTPRVLHSLAAVACGYVWSISEDPSAANVVVALKIEAGNSEAAVDLFAIVVIDAGLPVLDDVRMVEQAQAVAAGFLSGERGFSNYRLLTNDLESFPAGELVEMPELLAFVGKSTLLVNPPVDRKKALLMFAVVAAVAGSGGWYKLIYEPQKKKADALKAAQMADPLPQYQSDLAAQIGQMGVDRHALVGLISRLENYPLWVSGWSLEGVICEAGSCSSTWLRRGGLLEDLRASLPGHQVVPGGFDQVVMQFQADMPIKGLASRGDAVEKAAAIDRSTNVYQGWANAGVVVRVASGAYQTWPSGPPELPAAETMKNQGLEVVASFPLAKEVVMQAPSDVWWKGFALKVAPGDKTGALIVTLKGDSYVR